MDPILSAFSEPVNQALPKIPQALLAFAVGVIVLHLLQWIFEKTLRLAKAPRSLQQILGSIVQVVLWVILIAAVFQSIGLTQIAFTLSGSVAIIGIALGAGANALVQDIITGLFLARDRDFNVGYRIKIGDVEGTIKQIDIRKVRIEADNGNIYVVPNSNLDKASWVVLDREPAQAKIKTK
jgi:small-conductance mechanosensitive channel